MEIEWDSKKAISNLKKHGVDFADAVTVLVDERAITISEDYPDEERFITIGMDSFNQILVVVYTWRETRIRIISARKATAKEIKQYKGEFNE
ncbi:MAG: BrnT family toxin [Candidatus Aminicenantaceae bacterium]